MQIKELNDRYVSIGVGLAGAAAAVGGDRLEARRVPEARRRRRARPRARLEASLSAAGYPVAARHWRELAVFYKQVRLLYIGIFGFVGAVLVVIVILSAAIVMTMAVTERTREIGTLRALGTRPSGILRMFLAEGVAIAVGGLPRRRARRARHPIRVERVRDHPAAAARRHARDADPRRSSTRWRTGAGSP